MGLMAENSISGLLTIFEKYPHLDGVQKLLVDAINYRNTGHDGKGNEVRNRWIAPEDFEKEFKYSESAFRTIQGTDHTYYVMDIDTTPDENAFRMNTDVELRELRLRAVIKSMEEILNYDTNFFAYLSGKGGYLIRKVYPNVDKEIFIHKIQEILPMCQEDHKHEKYCSSWHKKEGRRSSFYRWQKVDGYKFTTGIDLIILKGKGARVFRIPYSPYPKIGGGNIFICSPIIFDATGSINVAKSIKNTDPRYTEIIDFTIPEEYMDISAYKGIVIDTKAVRTTRMEDHLHGEVKLNIPEPYAQLSQQEEAIVRRIDRLLTAPPATVPPCMKNAYLKELPDGHWSRVLLARYLFHMGFSIDEIALFIRNKINDAEDNSPQNEGQMERNLSLSVIPTENNPKIVPGCAAIQNPSGTFYACKPEDAEICGRKSPLSKPTSTRAYKARAKAIAQENLIEKQKDRPGRIKGIGKYNKIVRDVRDIINDPAPTLVKKTTRAGLTTSLVIACQKEKKRGLVLVPTNKIAKETFPTAVEIGKDIYKVDINGAVLSSNPKGCLKVMEMGEKAKQKKASNPQWGDKGIGVLKLPILMKPPCSSAGGNCEYFHNTFDIKPNSVITDSRLDTMQCARISVLRNMSKFDVIFSTYAKLMATLNDTGDEAMVALSEIKDYDVIMLDEVSSLLGGQAHQIEIAGRRDNVMFLRSDKLREQLAILAANVKSTERLIKYIERALSTIESSVRGLDIAFIRGGVKTVVIKNPLSVRERRGIIVQYAILQNVVEKTNYNLSLLANFILALTDEEWYLTAVTNMYSYTTISMVTKPELSILKAFIKTAIEQKKKIVITDASLPPMSMKALLNIDVMEVNLGDPRGTNELSLVIPDTKKVNISTLERSEEEQIKVLDFCERVIERHGAKDIIIVAPNKKRTYRLLMNTLGKKYPKLSITYFRSDETIGTEHHQRTMVAICKPLPPEDSLNWLATHYNKEQGADISATSEMLRRHSARQAFYQTIGRVKDPSAATPSVIYTYGTRKWDVKKLIGEYPSPIIIDSPSSKIEYRLITGTHWRRTAEILPTSISAASRLIDERGRVTLNRLQKLMKEGDFRLFMNQLSTFGYVYDQNKNSILSSNR
jgi:hypothetical protein